jgi:hypothetical protein
LIDIRKDVKMIRYSTQPSKNAKALTDSPTSSIVTTKDVKSLNGTNDQQESKSNLQDLDAQDENDN